METVELFSGKSPVCMNCRTRPREDSPVFAMLVWKGGEARVTLIVLCDPCARRRLGDLSAVVIDRNRARKIAETFSRNEALSHG